VAAAPIRIALALVATLAFAMLQDSGCGFTPEPLAGEGEPCTRDSECQSHLECRGGTCRTRGGFDAGSFDAGGPRDAGADAGSDGGLDGSIADAAVDAGDAGEGGVPDAGDDPPDEDGGLDGSVGLDGAVDGGGSDGGATADGG